MRKIQRALLSVTDKTGLVDFASFLQSQGVELISTGGTSNILRDAKLDVLDVSDVTGFPEMLDGRVKTLHPNIAGGILAMRSNLKHREAMAEHGIAEIDMVVVNLYDFEATASRPGATFEELIEHIDIGGPTLIRAAAKNFQDVAVVTDPMDYPWIQQEMKNNNCALSKQVRWEMARKAFHTTASYDCAITGTLANLEPGREPVKEHLSSMPAFLNIQVPRKQVLRYGENPHQQAALYSIGTHGIAGAKQLHGKDLSYNNLVDLDAALQLAWDFDNPAVAIIKHTNPCGCAENNSLAEAYRKALACDPVSAFGSVIAVNCVVDYETAEEMSKLFIEALAAPGFTQEAVDILSRKKNLRLMEIGSTEPGVPLKSISGGFLMQSEDCTEDGKPNREVVTKRQPTGSESTALRFAWKVVKHVKSNAILYASAGQTIGVGAGQMSRVDAARIGASKAVLPLKGCVAASDAFFPFPDGLEEIASHGATAVIQPGGSKNDDKVIQAADHLNLAMIFTGMRHFRH